MNGTVGGGSFSGFGTIGRNPSVVGELLNVVKWPGAGGGYETHTELGLLI